MRRSKSRIEVFNELFTIYKSVSKTQTAKKMRIFSENERMFKTNKTKFPNTKIKLLIEIQLNKT
jgi:hypothetical protein